MCILHSPLGRSYLKQTIFYIQKNTILITYFLYKDTFQGYTYWDKHICTRNVINTELRRKL